VTVQLQKLTGFNKNDHINFNFTEKSSIYLSMQFSSLLRKEDFKETHICVTQDWDRHTGNTQEALSGENLNRSLGYFSFQL